MTAQVVVVSELGQEDYDFEIENEEEEEDDDHNHDSMLFSKISPKSSSSSTSRREQRKQQALDINNNCNHSHSHNHNHNQILMKESGKKRKRERTHVRKVGYVCTHCGSTSTPEWRKGPLGKNTLCNACGLQFAKNLKRHQQCKDKELKLGYILHPYNREVSPSDVLWLRCLTGCHQTKA